ncbi:MAG: CRISPR-associated endonuclease Cas2 [Micrococcus sp.]|nr:CRISPR-associated endonuclease Cas2 [Micrococcus sp.]
MRRTLVAYDIPSDKRRAKVARILEEYGDRIQYSVFVLDLLPAGSIRMKAEIEAVMDLGEDSILFCDLGLCSALGPEQFSFLGVDREVTGQGPLIV